jgi:P27 family predicted phage terminase small subunit
MKTPTASKIPAPPDGLSKASRAWWRAVLSEYELEAHLLRVLEAACKSWDRMSQASTQIEKEGMFLPDRNLTLRAHPAVQVERNAAISFARLVRELGLQVGDPDGRPPRVGTGRTS